MKDNWYIKRRNAKSADQAETDLVLKIYKKQQSAYNKGTGPKPNLEELVNKSRVRVFDPDCKLPQMDIKAWNGEIVESKKISFPKGLKIKFIEESKPLPGFYLLQFDTGIKFGISTNITRRMIEYRKPWCKPIVKSLYTYLDIKLAKNIEESLKRDFYLHDISDGSTEFLANKSLPELIKVIKSTVRDYSLFSGS